MSALSQFLQKTVEVGGGPRAQDVRSLVRHLLCDTHGVLALADQRLPVVLPLWADCDELKRVGPSTELPVGWFHLLSGAVGQAEAANGILAEEERRML